jgi:DNA-binding response OmpR family regulator
MDTSQNPSSIITVGPISVDRISLRVSVGDKRLGLTPTEVKVLHFLAVNVNEVCTADQITSHVYRPNFDEDNVLVKAHIRHLRQKMEPDPAHPSYILTVPDVGYKLVVPDGD